MPAKDEKQALTCMDVRVQSVGRNKKGKRVDATKRRFKEKLDSINRKLRLLNAQRETLLKAIKLAGISFEEEPLVNSLAALDYVELPFKEMKLVDTFKKILTDHEGQVLSKEQMHQLAKFGGYEFSSSDPKHSIEGTLRRLVNNQFCEARRVPGSRRHEYIFVKKEL